MHVVGLGAPTAPDKSERPATRLMTYLRTEWDKVQVQVRVHFQKKN